MTQAGIRGLVRYQRRDELRLGFPRRNVQHCFIKGPPWARRIGLFRQFHFSIQIHSSGGLGWVGRSNILCFTVPECNLNKFSVTEYATQKIEQSAVDFDAL